VSTTDDRLYQRISDYLGKKARNKASLRGSGLIDRIARDLRSNRTDVLRAMRDLRADGIVCCDDWLRDEPQGKVSIHVPRPLSPSASAWCDTLRQHGYRDDSPEFSALQAMGDRLDGLDTDAMRRLLAGLIALAQEQHELFGTPRFELSARYLLGSSKLLDALPGQALQRFGIDASRFPSFPGYVIVAGPPRPSTVTLVENPHSFEAAVTVTAGEQAAWVCTYGYGLSLKHSQHGEQLAALLASPTTPRTLTRHGQPPAWEQLLQHPRLRFWGDLDLEGLAIFERLRAHRPDIALSGLYQPMLEALRQGKGHPYCEAVGKPKQRLPRCRDDIDTLIDLCRHQAVDQELVTRAQIGQLWDRELQP
jgi:hypothetical protein